ncbi:MAG TPA: hypothetical protein VGU25_15395 [Acidobacteriaceae bacterium]|nr:hypothetical protein [Acidobacteriaceae bacterium]
MWEQLWRRTVTLVREYPLLWLPVIVADLGSSALKASKSFVMFYLLRFAFRGHSVLGFATVDPTANGLAYALTGGWAQVTRFACIALYAAAFLVTSRMVMQQMGRPRSDGRNLIGASLLLGLRAFLFAIPLILASFLPITLAVTYPRWHPIVAHWLFSDLLGLLIMCGLAYLMVPVALHAVAEVRSGQAGGHLVQTGRTWAFAGVTASTSLIILEHIVLGISYGTHSEVLAIRAIASLIAALPYAPLYVALSLLAKDEEPEVPPEHVALVPGEV